MFKFQIDLIHHLIMHLLLSFSKCLCLVKIFILEIRNEMERGEKTVKEEEL